MEDAEFVSLFSGVGGLDLAVEAVFGRAPTLLCEADPYCRAVLEREWPGVPCVTDVAKVELRSCAEASPAKTLATQGSAPGSTGIDRDCGWTWRGAFAIYDPPSSSWKTSEGSLFEASTAYSETYPPSGTMRNGRLFERRTLAPLTCAPVSSSSPYDAPYPTPSATAYGSSGNGSGNNVASRGRPGLEAMAKSWPTPVVTDSKSAARGTTTTGIMHPGVTLTDAMRSHQPSAPTQPGSDGAEVAVLNPAFVEALMGLRPEWTHVGDDTASSVLETQWCRNKLGMRSKDSSSEPSKTD